jgi:hypothetical protein
MNIELTTEEIDALSEVLDLAYGDQNNYMDCGDPHMDYGAEWPFVAIEKATRFRIVAAVTGRLGLPGERERWQQLAANLDASAEEYKEMHS